MKKNIIMVLLFVMVLGGTLLARENLILKVKVQTANVRSEPDAAAAIVAKVSIGTLLEFAGKDGAWYEVTVNDQSGKEVTGYIHSTVVEVLGGKEEAREEKPRAAVGRETPRARARKEFAGGGFKLMGGLSMSNMNVSEAIPTDAKKSSKMGLTGGVGYEGGGRIAFEMDLLYSPGGAVIKSTDPASKEKIDVSGNAISLPLMLKVRFLPGTTPYVLAGGEVGYILSQKVVVTAADGSTSEVDVTDNLNRLFYGLIFGAGVEMRTGGLNLFLEARYRLGLSNQVKDPAPGVYTKATALIIMLGIKF